MTGQVYAPAQVEALLGEGSPGWKQEADAARLIAALDSALLLLDDVRLYLSVAVTH